MSRRVSLPGADELFRTTGGMGLQASQPRKHANGDAQKAPQADGRLRPVPDAPADGNEPQTGTAPDGGGQDGTPAEHSGREGIPQGRRPQAAGQPPTAPVPVQQTRRKQQRPRPSGRERHDEKITVYVSAEELMDLEHARLVLRGEHGLAIDRGRIVREAVAVVLADLESRGDASILVRRLRGR
ncbi:hypothetical protein G3I60_42040 [Streptomyces sp. SID13666]|nr:hypothetical protein [Streptomyces sp. SID13666]NEA71382.1 hypothetical protein [Streptomyces sp. SID13588]QNA72680.1 hypothetical protein C8250_012820 [Streptomyces sp. So13.3]